MPVLKRKEFQARPWPLDLSSDHDIFYLPITNEVFLTHEEFFQRQITLNSMIWSCAATGKTGLTFEEAQESERTALESLEKFPESFGKAILYLVERLSLRGRLDDLVTDIYYFVKDRYLVGEEVTFNDSGKKRQARVLNVSYQDDVNAQTDSDGAEEFVKKPAASTKRGELRMASPEHYGYMIQIVSKQGKEEDSGVKEHVPFTQISRSRTLSSRQKLKLFLKNSCQSNAERLVVKTSLIEEYGVASLSWSDIFGGPLAQFPHTPIMPRGPPKGTPRSNRKTEDENGVLLDSSQNTTQESEPGSGKKPRGRPKGSVNKSKDEDMKSTPKSGKKKSGKLRKEIEKQQEELRSSFHRAHRLGVEDMSRWEQEDRLLSSDDIAELKRAIRSNRDMERERAREIKQREREALMEWKRQRDDVECDDLKELPQFNALPLPEWMSEEEFGELLLVYQFFYAFSDVLPIKEVRGCSKVTFSEVIKAVHSNDPRSAVFVELMHVLLMAKTERGNEEDGDEVEYAQKAVDNGGTMVALRGKDGVVTAVDKLIPSKLYVSNANPRMANAGENVGVALAGVYPDCKALLDYAVGEALKYLREYRTPMPIKKLADQLAEYVHIFTLGISRPFGASVFLTAWDEKKGSQLYLIEPSGLAYEYKAWAIGKHRQAAKTEIEKLKLENMTMDQLVKEAARIIMTVRDEAKDKNIQIEMGWVGRDTHGKHHIVPQEVVKGAEAWAKTKLEEDDMEE